MIRVGANRPAQRPNRLFAPTLALAPEMWQYQVTITVEDVEALAAFRVDETLRLAQEIGSETP